MKKKLLAIVLMMTLAAAFCLSGCSVSVSPFGSSGNHFSKNHLKPEEDLPDSPLPAETPAPEKTPGPEESAKAESPKDPDMLTDNQSLDNGYNSAYLPSSSYLQGLADDIAQSASTLYGLNNLEIEVLS